MPGRPPPESLIQAPPPAPGEAAGARRVHVVALEQVHPVIRIAHRRRHRGDLRIAERIIFDHELVLMVHGQGRLVTTADTIPLEPGMLACIGPFVPHRFEADARGMIEHVAIHFDLAPHVPGDDGRLSHRRPYEVRFPRGRRLPPVAAAPLDGDLAKRVCEVVSLHQTDDDLSTARAGATLLRVVLTLLGRSPADASAMPPGGGLDPRVAARLDRAIAWIGENLHRDIDVADVAEVADFSASHLTRLFTEWTGHSPKAFIRRARIDRARKLLADVDLSIKQIAFQTGFKDPYHFSKAFRQIDGLPPSHYREALLAGRGRPNV